MSRSSAWTLADLELGARHAAEDAARREGVSLEEWLSEAIEDRAVCAPPRYRGRDVETRHGRALRRRRDDAFLPEHSESDAEPDWVQAIEGVERRIALGERRAQRAFESIALALERTQKTRDEARSENDAAAPPLPEPARQETAQEKPASPGPAAPAIAPSPAGLGSPFAPRPQNQTPAATRSSSTMTDKRQRDLSAAVSEIAMRRRQLDARAAAPTPPSQTTARAQPAAPGRTSGATDQGDDLRALILRIEELSRKESEDRVSGAEIGAMRAEIAGMIQSLADLAPRNAVVALEGAMRDLSERVAILRQNREVEHLLKPLEAMASELRAAIRAYDPQIAAAALEREIHAIGGKIDGLAETAISPETFERILRQTEEVRNLLSAAANRSPPLEQFERRIGALADRVEALGASPAPQMECAQMAASLAQLRREIERSTPVSALAAIEGRLEQIASRLDEAILARPHGAAVDPAPFEDLARRIDDVRHVVEARPQASLDTSALEASLRELTARLDRPGAEPAAEAAPVIDLAPVEDALRSLNARLETGNPAALDPQIIDRVADEIVRRMETRNVAEPVLLSRQIAEIHTHLEALAERAMNPPESAVHAMIERLRESLAAPGAPGADGARLATELSQMRAEQASAERQTQSRLGALQDGFEKLLERLTSIESELSTEASESPSPRRPASAASASSARAAEDLDAYAALGRRPASGAPSHSDDEAAPDPAIPEDFLLEPGSGATELGREARDLANAIGSRTSPSVSVHIAAARRAAQAAVEIRTPAPGAPGGSLAERGASLYAAHRRSVLLAVALAILATVAIRLNGAHGPVQKSELDVPARTAAVSAPPKPSAPVSRTPGAQTPVAQTPGSQTPGAQTPAPKPVRPPEPGPGAVAPEAVDPTPTASIGQAPGAKSAVPAAPRLPPPDLLATLPPGLPPVLREGVLSGAASAQYELGQRLMDGRGVPQDRSAAARWFEQAANAGFAPAQYRIGAIYEKGVGAPRDLAAARGWYLSAAKAGNARAAHNLGVMAAEPQGGGSPDYAEAAKWFRRAGELGIRDSQYNLAVLYARGLGVDQDLRQSWMWFSLAAAQGDADAAKKRDDVAAKLDPAELAAAAELLAGFRIQTPDPQANDADPPPGGWDGKASMKSGQSFPVPTPGQRLHRVL